MKPLVEPPETGQPNLSEAIVGTVEREPGDQVRCVRLYDDCYRCNWWSPVPGKDLHMPLAPWEIASAYRIRKSVFVRAVMIEGKLSIKY